VDDAPARPAERAEGESPSDPPLAARSGWSVGRLVKVAFAVGVLGFGAAFVFGRWDQLRHALSQASVGWIVVATLLVAVGQWAASLGFRSVLSAAGREIPVIAAGRVYFVSQLGKYLPGSIWPIVVITEMSRRYGISRKASAIAGVLGMYFAMTTAAVLGVILVPLGAIGHSSRLLWLILLAPVLIAMLHPRVVIWAVAAALRLTRRQPLAVEFTSSQWRGAVGWPALCWALFGLHCWVLVIALGGPATASLGVAVGGFCLAYTAGTLFVPTPAGAGVREAVLGVALAAVITESAAFTNDSIVVVVLLSRVTFAVLDFGQAGAAMLLSRRSHHVRVAR
jgi:glycosyltransferase 2 family protein